MDKSDDASVANKQSFVVDDSIEDASICLEDKVISKPSHTPEKL